MNGREKRRKRAERARNTAPSREAVIKRRPCTNCGGRGPHFVPPCFGRSRLLHLHASTT